jgi:hypothetical protein
VLQKLKEALALLLDMCPHATLCVLTILYMCVLILKLPIHVLQELKNALARAAKKKQKKTIALQLFTRMQLPDMLTRMQQPHSLSVTTVTLGSRLFFILLQINLLTYSSQIVSGICMLVKRCKALLCLDMLTKMLCLLECSYAYENGVLTRMELPDSIWQLHASKEV